MEWIDIGANLTHESFARDRDEVLERAAQAGVRQIVVTGASVSGSEEALELARRHPGALWATAGVHPHEAASFGADARSELAALARADEVVAIGEAGLDFHRDFSPRPAQERAFEEQIELAAETDLPLFVHARDAHQRVREMLYGERDRLGAVVLHCFTGERKDLYACLDLDLHIGITGWICDERRGRHLNKLVGDIPRDRLMLETDAPYLLPRDLSPRPSSRRNEPKWLVHVAQTVATATGETLEALAARTTATARAFFRLPDALPANPDVGADSDSEAAA